MQSANAPHPPKKRARGRKGVGLSEPAKAASIRMIVSVLSPLVLSATATKDMRFVVYMMPMHARYMFC